MEETESICHNARISADWPPQDVNWPKISDFQSQQQCQELSHQSFNKEIDMQQMLTPQTEKCSEVMEFENDQILPSQLKVPKLWKSHDRKHCSSPAFPSTMNIVFSKLTVYSTTGT
ncbi:unnamed protein product [Protopolystoma xenopodis]|uniref:Uncharacterized protein n=1 Tax=Protopolystoma xenopodis TaxID=117903 RepID=A0A448X9X3_9PLAT|nr:unnamed protein product [Protopolystoma xenopodis]